MNRQVVWPTTSLIILASIVALAIVDTSIAIPAALMVAVAGVAVAYYRSWTSPFSGSTAIVVATMVSVLVLGTLPRAFPAFDVNPVPEVWLVYISGFTSMLVGCVAGARVGRRQRTLPPDRFSRDVPSIPLYVGIAGAIGVSAVNFATGVIPALAGDINAARFGDSSDFGVLGRFWPLAIPILQVAVVVSVICVMRAGFNSAKLPVVLGLLSFILLILNGGRSLFVIPLIAGALIYIDARRPALRYVIGVIGGGAVILGIIGYYRSLAGASSAVTRQFFVSHGLNSRFGSLDLSLQAGPRVFSQLLSQAPQAHFDGKFLLGDINNFFHATALRSDRMITASLHRDPSQVGGLPPTIWGGFYVDFGIIGVVVGGLIIGTLLALSRSQFLERRSISSAVWHGYFSAYVLISCYSYISVRPSWLVVLGCAAIASRRIDSEITAYSDGLKVPGVSRWR